MFRFKELRTAATELGAELNDVGRKTGQAITVLIIAVTVLCVAVTGLAFAVYESRGGES